MTKKLINILVVEDDPIIGLDIVQTLEGFGWNAVGPIADAANAKKEMQKQKFDLVLLDVELEGVNDGTIVAEYINNKIKIPFIYITSYSDSLSLKRIKATEPAAYLHKPFDAEELKANIEIALYKQIKSPSSKISEEHLFVRSQGAMIKLLPKDILFIKAEDNYSFIHTAEKEFLVSSTLKGLESKFLPLGFIRVHRSYIINLIHVHTLSDLYVHISDIKIPIGRSYRQDFLSYLKVV